MRIAVVVPRYGREVNGGAETLAREYATRLAPRHDVTVLTTCALDYRTWADHFPAGESTEDGVRVVRFPVPVPRDGAAFDALSAHVLTAAENTPDDEERWMDSQGPNALALLDHLRDEGRRYDVVVFIPYLYATTVRGLPLVADRAVLVPAFHDEPPLRLGIFDRIAGSAQALVFSTPEEQNLALRRFRLQHTRQGVVGAGIDAPPPTDATRGMAAVGVERPYVVCVGRIDASKGSDDLIRAHRDYRGARPEGADLVMLGRSVIDLPKEKWLHTPGFVDEETKHDLIAGALALVAPSPYESLSLVLLESWSHGVPTVSSARSPVLVGQSRRSGGGLWYRDAAEYGACLDLLAERPALANGLGRAGWRFAQTLTWPHVIARLENLLAGEPAEGISAAPATSAASPRSVVTGLPGGPVQIGVDVSSEAAVAEALQSAGIAAQLHVVEPGGDPRSAWAIRLPCVPADILEERLATMDLVVTADTVLRAALSGISPAVRVVSPDGADLLPALRQAAESAGAGV